ncbi:MAG: alkaline phosphatase [Pontiellaceae bacterium]|nr:alkaline phosphatase [Pontiellaceae bacterium]
MFKLKARFYLIPLASMLIFSGCIHTQVDTAEEPTVKYVFFFLGDGMSSAQIQAAQAFQAENENRADSLLAPESQLNMTQLSAAGLCTTFSADRFITDSAAAATAFTCGIKTRPDTLGRNAARDVSYKSIAELAQEKGSAIGIISSAPLSHATPAGYYANVNNRNSYSEISYQASQSGFDFFGGSVFADMNDVDNSGKIAPRDAFLAAGYITVRKKDQVLALKDKELGKVICSVNTIYNKDAMPYAIDRPPENFSLAEVTQVAINYLQNDPEGFFIMVEGGKIDWSCHANDIVTTIHEVIAFDDAIGVAMEFMKAHPDETLIVVTGDHETGGLSMGNLTREYGTSFRWLKGQTRSADRFIEEDLPAYRKTHRWRGVESNIDDDMKRLIKSQFGIDWDRLPDHQKEWLELAYDISIGEIEPPPEESHADAFGYTGDDALCGTLIRILTENSGIGWATTAHTAVPLPVMAGGAGAELFSGFYDNTDIPKKMGQIMGLPTLPVVDPDRPGPMNY